jgi:hypothetical protein
VGSLAVPFHASRGEARFVGFNIVPMLLALLVA